jgi:hypothetical protein
MANARLHLICGNCGCDDEWEYEYEPKQIDQGIDANVFLWCKNCTTMHSLNEKAEIKNRAQIKRD